MQLVFWSNRSDSYDYVTWKTSWKNSVIMLTGLYGCSSILVFARTSRPAHSTTCSRHPGLSFSGIKRSGREAHHSRIAEVMNAYSHRRTSVPPYVFMTSRFIKHKAILHFYLRTDGQRIASNNEYGTYCCSVFGIIELGFPSSSYFTARRVKTRRH